MLIGRLYWQMDSRSRQWRGKYLRCMGYRRSVWTYDVQMSSALLYLVHFRMPISSSTVCFENQSLGVVAISPNAKYLVSASDGDTSIIGINRWTYGVDELDGEFLTLFFL